MKLSVRYPTLNVCLSSYTNPDLHFPITAMMRREKRKCPKIAQTLKNNIHPEGITCARCTIRSKTSLSQHSPRRCLPQSCMSSLIVSTAEYKKQKTYLRTDFHSRWSLRLSLFGANRLEHFYGWLAFRSSNPPSGAVPF